MNMPKHSHTQAEYSFTIISRVYWPCLHTFTRNESNIHEQSLLKCRSGWLVCLSIKGQTGCKLFAMEYNYFGDIFTDSRYMNKATNRVGGQTLYVVGSVEHAISLLFGIWFRVRAFSLFDNTCMYGISKSFSSHAYPDNSWRNFQESQPNINVKTSLWHR